PLHERALAICERVLGAEHSETADSLSVLALLHQAQSDLPTAERLMRRALQIFETKLGPTHPNTERSRRGLAAIVQQRAGAAGADGQGG
ncbi:MAG: tetratricopeptide repeat protein, partial [Candidatus Viridilinea halotolerans]